MKRLTTLFSIWLILCYFQTSGLSQADDIHRSAEKVLVPSKSWTCNMADGIPPLEHLTPLFEAELKLRQIYDVGQTPYGHRVVFVVETGKISGEKIHGTVMSGGLDLQLSFTNSAMEVEQVFVIKTDDGKFIYLHNAGTAVNDADVRMSADFQAPTNGNYTWLNAGKYVARRTVDREAKTMRLTYFYTTHIGINAADTNCIFVVKPNGLPDQPSNFRRVVAGEEKGEQFVSEHVTLGPGQWVGATKQGGRNIIPITGGTLSGKIRGKVLNAGADYQKLLNPMVLDARYLWQTDEGDIIIVRNGGTVGSLAPTFEVRVDCKYAWLNKEKFLSSSPIVGTDGVRLNFFLSSP